MHQQNRLINSCKIQWAMNESLWDVDACGGVDYIFSLFVAKVHLDFPSQIVEAVWVESNKSQFCLLEIHALREED